MVIPSALLEQWQAAESKANELLQAVDSGVLEAEKESLQNRSLDPNLWSDPEKAKQVQQGLARAEAALQLWEDQKKYLEDGKAFLELASDMESEAPLNELRQTMAALERANRDIELQTYLSGPYDRYDAILSVHSGQGGTEAMDWAGMVARMYERYFERHNWKYEKTEESRGEEAGIKSATYLVHTPYAYGYLRGENGTHRLVRQSPFNADALRQTSFCGVEVLPLIPEDDASIQIKPDELEWQFTRAGGHGGQNVNKVNTAVYLTHLPTGIVIHSRQERSQEQNRNTALQMLRAQLAERLEAARHEEIAQIKGKHVLASWGNQIRNYVLHPYHLVKDTRTEVETSDTDAVLDGDLDQFLFAEITQL